MRRGAETEIRIPGADDAPVRWSPAAEAAAEGGAAVWSAESGPRDACLSLTLAPCPRTRHLLLRFTLAFDPRAETSGWMDAVAEALRDACVRGLDGRAPVTGLDVAVTDARFTPGASAILREAARRAFESALRKAGLAEERRLRTERP